MNDNLTGIRRSLEANRAAYEAIRAGLRSGMTERDAYALVRDAVDRVCGGEPHEFIGDFVGGARTGAIEGQPTDYVLKPGDLFILDLSVRRGEIWSDTCRTFFLGEPTQRQRDAYAAVLACQDEGAKHIRAGVVASSVRPPMMDVLARNGFGGRMPHHGGHLVGPKPYMKPAFEDGCDEPVHEGDVCTLEPGVYFEGEWGMRVENDYLVTANGVENHFLAYLFMGLPCGMVLKRRGYRFTSLAAVAVGILGVSLQVLAGFVASFGVYVAGAFVAGLAMCMLNVTANPMMNTLGGGGNGGNRLVQYGCMFNSVGGMSSPLILGFLIGDEISKANVLDALPVQAAALAFFVFGFFAIMRADIPEPHLEPDAPSPWRDVLAAFRYRHFALGALAMFLFEPVECGICNMVNLYLTAEGTPAYAGAVVGGTMVSAYCALMMVGRFGAGVLGNRVSPRAMISSAAVFCIVLLLAAVNIPFVKVAVPFTGVSVPLSALLMTACGLGISVMFGGIFNLATEGLGRLVPVASGITMSLVSGGALLAVVGMVADRFGILSSCYAFVALLAYIMLYAVRWSRAEGR